MKNQLNSVLNNIFSPYLAAYRESYNTQHVLIRLLEEWRENLDNNYTVKGGGGRYYWISRKLSIASLMTC